MKRIKKVGLESNPSTKKQSASQSKTETGKKKKTSSKKIVRSVYRIPVEDKKEITVKVNNKPYDIVNLSHYGIGIRINKENIFSVGQKLNSVSITIKGESYKLGGKVSHISPDAQTKKYLCGIELIGFDKKIEKSIIEYIMQCKSNLFFEDIEFEI